MDPTVPPLWSACIINREKQLLTKKYETYYTSTYNNISSTNRMSIDNGTAIGSYAYNQDNQTTLSMNLSSSSSSSVEESFLRGGNGMLLVQNALHHTNGTHHFFSPYGPPQTKHFRNENRSMNSISDLPHRSIENQLNVIPTVNLTSRKQDTEAKTSISTLVERTQLSSSNCSLASPITSNLSELRNGSFGSFIYLTNPSVGDTSDFSSYGNNSFNTSTSSTSTLNTPKTDNLAVKYGKMGRFVFNNQNKPMRLFFTKALYFSNHYPCERLSIDGVKYSCTEQYYMYYKAYVFGDLKTAQAIMQTTDPKTIKRLGSSVEGFNEEKWHKLSIVVMCIASMRKYEQNSELRRQLFQTADSELVEANPTDHRWGIGLSIDSDLVVDKSRWRGANIMGRLLTLLRDRLLRRQEFAAELNDLYAQHPYDLKSDCIAFC